MGSHAAPTGEAGKEARLAHRVGRAQRLGGWLLILAWAEYGQAAVRNGVASHETIGYYVVSVICLALILVLFAVAVGWARKTAKTRQTARPRWQYGIAALGIALAVAAGVIITVAAAGHLPRWWPTGAAVRALTPLGAFALICGTILAALMLGRAVARGRLRLCFWLIEEPRWLTPE
jgi:hypothetical protein